MAFPNEMKRRMHYKEVLFWFNDDDEVTKIVVHKWMNGCSMVPIEASRMGQPINTRRLLCLW